MTNALSVLNKVDLEQFLPFHANHVHAIVNKSIFFSTYLHHNFDQSNHLGKAFYLQFIKLSISITFCFEFRHTCYCLIRKRLIRYITIEVNYACLPYVLVLFFLISNAILFYIHLPYAKISHEG